MSGTGHLNLEYVFGCSNGHTFSAGEPGWDKLYCPASAATEQNCPGFGDGWQCMRPLMLLHPTDESIVTDLVTLEAELR